MLPPFHPQEEYDLNVKGFWSAVHAVAKAIARNDLMFASRLFHVELNEYVYSLLSMEAKKLNIFYREDMRCANEWLSQLDLEMLSQSVIQNKKELSELLVAKMNYFDDVSNRVAQCYQLKSGDYSELKLWLKKRLNL